MDIATQKSLRFKLAKYARPNDRLAYLILAFDLAIYLGAVFLAITSASPAIKILGASLAGFMIAQLFVIGHDAAHQAYVSKPKLNAFIARLAFLPSLHNYSLWLFVHNRVHHAYPNVQHYNSWSPLSLREFSALPRWKQLVYKLYRSPVGFGPYYIFERWLKDKFFPRSHLPKASHKGGWRDFVLLSVYLVTFVSVVTGLAIFANQSVASAILYAVVIPFIIWTYAMGMTIYQHHTHATIKWYENLAAWKNEVKHQGEVTVHMKYPHWYNFITHNIYIHPVHHINARIPLYHLPQAEEELVSEKSSSILTLPFTLKGFVHTVAQCKLYDYENQQWLNYQGQPTTASLKEQDAVQWMVS